MANWWFLAPNIPDNPSHLLNVKTSAESDDDRLNTLKKSLKPKSVLSKQDKSDDSIDLFCSFEDDQEDFESRLKETKLSDNGALYFEINRLHRKAFFFSPRRVLNKLKSSGFEEVGLYFVFPNFRHPKIYLPYQHPSSFVWYLDNMIWQDSVFKVAALACARWILKRIPGLLKWLFPFFVVTAVKKPSTQTEKFDLAKSLNSDYAEAWPALLHNGIDAGNRNVMFLFSDHQAVPQQVVKVSSSVEMNHTTENEIQVKRNVLAKLGNTSNKIPAELETFQYFGLRGHVESAAAGQLLTLVLSNARTSQQRKIEILNKVSAWITEFDLQTTSASVAWTEEMIETHLASQFAEYKSIFGETPAINLLSEKCLAASRQLIGKKIPLPHVHYDFAPWNIYYNAGELTVIDWEFDRVKTDSDSGLPLFDLLYFVTYWHHLVEKMYTVELENGGFERLFLSSPKNNWSLAVNKAIETYLSRMNIDRQFKPIMLVYLWLEQSIYQHKRRLKLDLVEPQDPKKGNRMVKFIDLLAENSSFLFPDR